MGLGIRAFARKVNVTPAAVTKSVKNGRLLKSVMPDGTLNEREALREWVENASQPLGGNPKGAHPINGVASALQTARAHSAALEAKLLEIEYRRKIKELVPVEEMRHAVYETARRVRDRLQTIPARLAPVVAGLAGSQDECYAAIEREVNEVLDDLADMRVEPKKV